jgi:hypothetical protein
MPKIIKESNFEDLLEKEKKQVKCYLPKWKAGCKGEDGDYGVALMKIFAHMQEEIISRLNRVPEKKFASFLEMIGIVQAAAVPAKVPVTFTITEGLREDVFISRRTQVSSCGTAECEPLNYETSKGFTACRASIEQILFFDPKIDEIFSHIEDLNAGREFKKGDSLQKHALYLGHHSLFNIKPQAEITIIMNLNEYIDVNNLFWSYWGENGSIPFTVVKKEYSDYAWHITLKPNEELRESSINGIKCFWICCEINSALKDRAAVSINSIEVKSNSKRIKPDIACNNFLPLDMSMEFYPFGRQPGQFDAFYIASKEAFSKKGADIKINFKKGDNSSFIAPVLAWEYWSGTSWSPLNVKYMKVGKDEIEQEVINFDFDLSVKFVCPDNFVESEFCGELNYWIRALLIEGNFIDKMDTEDIESIIKDSKSQEDQKIEKIIKLANSWASRPIFKPPIIKDITIEYLIGVFTPEYCLKYSNMEYDNFSEKCKEIAFSWDEITGDDCPRFRDFIFQNFNLEWVNNKRETMSISKDSVTIKIYNDRNFLSLKLNDNKNEAILDIDDIKHFKLRAMIENNRLNVYCNPFISFRKLRYKQPALFLGFDKPFDEGNISIFFSLNGDSSQGSEMEWHYLVAPNGLEVKKLLNVIDNTNNLAKSDTLEFLSPGDQEKTIKFGRECYWIAGFLKQGRELPSIFGIYPNTVWAEQVECYEDEILGSGDGEKSERFCFIRRPVIGSEIWIREGGVLSRDEKDSLSAEEIKYVTEESGMVVDSWIKWRCVADLYDSGPKDRHYVLDSAAGVIHFGDGIHGMIPPRGTDNIKASYKTTKGSKGNLGKGEINVLKSGITGVEKVSNHEIASGGTDMETLEDVLLRGPQLIRHRDRAVTIEDFERLAWESSSSIARARCFMEQSMMRIVIIPEIKGDMPQPSPELLSIARKHLLERAMLTIPPDRINISGPDYIKVSVSAGVYPTSIELAVPLKREIVLRLKEFFHPLTGGFDGLGWEFGRNVHLSDMYRLLGGIAGVDHVENLQLNDDWKDLVIEDAKMVCSGEHEIIIRQRD